ncbi:ATP-binding domain-containing protein [Microbacterium aurantiacum]|uniref:ATP-binding domain-containing protein n=2 Tax=Microbacterium aurantiacum TaxID=162393 RepID=A0ABT8FVG3_9MICO|nr:ATP-binding domain-containing protein [Microbacterium aurantiacum]
MAMARSECMRWRAPAWLRLSTGRARTFVRPGPFQPTSAGRTESQRCGLWALTRPTAMHKSKGKEFDGVVIVEGHHRSVFFAEREEAPHLATRRLLRVAITRARHKVVIVRPTGAAPLTG